MNAATPTIMKGHDNNPPERDYPFAPIEAELESDLYRLSFTELAIELSLSPTGSTRADRMEHEIRRRVAVDDRARESRQWLACVCLGAVFAIAGFALGAYMRTLPGAAPLWPRQASHIVSGEARDARDALSSTQATFRLRPGFPLAGN